MKTIETIFTAKGRWEIYSYQSKGKKLYGNRLIARNGNIICGNKDFNQKSSAIKNMKAVRRCAI